MAKATEAVNKKTGEVTTVSSTVSIAPPNIQTAEFQITGTAPYVQHKFSEKARKHMLQAQMAKGAARTGKKKQEPRNPKEDYEGATHRGPDGKCGMSAAGFRSALISACRLVGFTMTRAKLSLFVVPDFWDAEDGSPLIEIHGEREMHEGAVRLDSGVTSIAFRPMWREWNATVRIQYDADQFTLQDVTNLLSRAGMQVGVGEGRPDSKKSHGCGWGTFSIEQKDDKKAA